MVVRVAYAADCERERETYQRPVNITDSLGSRNSNGTTRQVRTMCDLGSSMRRLQAHCFSCKLVDTLSFRDSTSCCEYFIKVIGRTAPRNNFLGVYLHLLHRYKFRPSLAIFRWNTQLFSGSYLTAMDPLFCVIGLILCML
jgi:hypothetical protein